MLDSSNGRAARNSYSPSQYAPSDQHDQYADPAQARRKRRAATGARVGAAESASFFADGEAPRVRVEPARREPQLSRADLRARRERMEKRRKRRALQRQLTFGLMGRETDPHAATVAIPELDETSTGSIRVRSGRTGAIPTRTGMMPPPPTGSITLPAASADIIEADVTVDDPTPTGELSSRRDLRGKRPKTGRRSNRGPIGRAASNKRAWLSAVAIALVVAVPASQFMNRESDEKIEDAALTTDSLEMPPITQTRPPSPTTEQLKKNQERLSKAISTARKTSEKATKSKAPSKSPTGSKTSDSGGGDDTPSSKAPRAGGTTQVGLANLSDKNSGLGWASGMYMPGSLASNAEAFGDWRGRALDVVVDWPARANWDDLVNPDWLYRSWKDTSYTKVFGFPPFPEDGSTLQQCATGAYNDKWEQIAKGIKNAGISDSTVIRLGWEFNGDWYAWQASDTDAFKECWRQVVGAAESVAPALTWDWTVNRGVSAGLSDPTKAYPGDEYVDIVGLDSYDMWPGAVDEKSWNVHLNGKQGLNYWANWAKNRGKKISVPEWGVYPGTANAGNNGGDNPYYIAKMKNWFESLGSQLAYEAYFNEDAGYYAGSIYGSGQNPNAAAKYKEVYGN
ncbi:hypothetical protein LWF15_14725 [Kineosporia rhizophila]|uniref:glycoside hydrolase family 26 protein n=1 Tax=Kineosporia rhizophila TaxID=84633 RepID=UPI001E2C20C9|nr:hypothetical protein [Kineosporia rhizophila]